MPGNKITTFKDLDAWREGHILVLEVYKITRSFPREELFALISQMRRCAVSITSNIAEGFSRQSYKDKAYFYSTALGSLTELQSQIQIALDIGYMNDDQFKQLEAQSVKVHKILNGLIKSSRSHNS